MKLHVAVVILSLLQLGLPTGVAISDDEDKRNLRGGDLSYVDEIENEDLNEGLASEDMDRELRPFGQPPLRRRPGQSTRYGLNSLVGFRPYMNSNPTVSAIQQGNLPVSNVPKKGVFPKKGIFKKGGFPKKGFVTAPGTIPKRADGSADGAFVVGVQRQPSSLAQALGFYRVEQGAQFVFVQDPGIDDVLPTQPPTPEPEPTVSPMPTDMPSVSPTREPTTSPSHAPTVTPTKNPTATPTKRPTKNPTKRPTKRPTKSPTKRPTKNPTKRPTKAPTKAPTKNPTKAPTKNPTPAPV